MTKSKLILEILEEEVRPAIGCTEPVAIALASAHAAQALKNQPEKITILTSPAIYKNGMDVGIPGIEKTGLDVAAALGAALTDPSQGLELLGEIKNPVREKARKLLKQAQIKVDIASTDNPVYIEAILESGDKTARALVLDRHDNLVKLSLNEEILFEKEENEKDDENSSLKNSFYQKKILDIVEEIEKLPGEDLLFLLDGLEMNLEAAQQGTRESYGLGVGYNMQKSIEEGLVAQDFANLAYMLTAAASDVRMSGERIAVMSSSGSGNNGLTAILPLAALKEVKELDDDTLARALAISHILTSYVKHYIGRLSNLCGCSIAAAIGSGSAIAWVLYGKEVIPATINNIIANQSGVICDGAKPGCALKLGTAAITAVQAALLAKKGTVLESHNGITDPQVEKSIANLATLSTPGMADLDETVIEIMQSRG